MCGFVCAELDFAMFSKANQHSYNEPPRGDCDAHSTVGRESVDPKHRILHHLADHLVWDCVV